LRAHSAEQQAEQQVAASKKNMKSLPDKLPKTLH
jgi:hypothetical protein